MATVLIPLSSPGLPGKELGNEYTQVEVFYGEQQLLTDKYTVAAGFTFLPIYTVVALDPATGQIKPAVYGATLGAPLSATKAYGVTTCDAKSGDKIDIYRQASFNDQALCWDASYDTLAKREVAFIGGGSPGIIIHRTPTHGRVIPNRTGIVAV